MKNPEVIAETDSYIVINKPAGMAVEPPSHHPTVLDWLIDHKKIKTGDWAEESRVGVVHRLDSDTSGVLVWAKNSSAQEHLKLLWQGRQIQKTYLALVVGECPKEGTIELSLERDNKKDRQRVAIFGSDKARIAITTYKRLSLGTVGGQAVSLVEAHPITGRTHQIRVHMKAIGHPVIGDKLYGEKASNQAADALGLPRQFLHAWNITVEGKSYQAELPLDLSDALRSTEIVFKS